MPRPKPIQRYFEGVIGVRILKAAANLNGKKAKIVGPKKVYLPESRIHMNYYEREAAPDPSNQEQQQLNQQQQQQQQQQPTILFCHGIASSAAEFFALLKLLDLPPHIRLLIPEQVGHGADIERVFSEGVDAFEQPTPESMVETTSEFLDAVGCSRCTAVGTSMGGALVYFLRCKRPEVIVKTVLVEPAIRSCLADDFHNGMLQGTNNFVDFQSRDDVKRLFRTFLWTDPSKRNKNNKSSKQKQKKDPVPKLVYTAIYRRSQTDVPKGHRKAMTDKMTLASDAWNRNDANKENPFAVTTDVDPDCPRLVFWPEEDQICSHSKGMAFFGGGSSEAASYTTASNANTNYNTITIPEFSQSMATVSTVFGKTRFVTMRNCGHVFHADGRTIYDLVAAESRPFLIDFSSH